MTSQKRVSQRLATLAFACLATVVSSEVSCGADQPNVLFISVDDWNDWVGAYGNRQAKTPNLDKLAARGVAFRYAHTSAVYCAPARTSLLTGLNPHSTGAYTDEPIFASMNRPDVQDLPLWFHKHGYYVAGGGKIYHHMPGFIDMRGWDEYFIWNDDLKKKGWGLDSWGDGAPLPAELPASPIAKYLLQQEMERLPDRIHDKVNSHMEWGVLPNEAEQKMADTLCGNWAVDFLKKNRIPSGKPFFLGFGLYAPHKPNFVPQKYFEMYALKDIEQPGIFPGDLDDLPPMLRAKTIARKNYVDAPMRQLMCGKKAVHGYLAALTYADAVVGRVLDALDDGPFADNTIVVLWSDNGYHLGEKGCWAKHTLWERTSNVPFIWAGPGIARGKIVDTTVSLLDTYPTLTELCALPANQSNEGVSLASVLATPEKASDRTVLQSDHTSFSLINSSWRYTRYRNGEEELYNVADDPGEHRNLAAGPDHRATIQSLAELLPRRTATIGRSPGPEPDDLRLKLTGDSFEWVEKKVSAGQGR